MARVRLMVSLLCLAHSTMGFNLVARRQAIQTAIGAATLATPLAPAVARSKASVAPNKPEGVGANAGQYIREQYAAEYAAMAGDKGSRGIASAECAFAGLDPLDHLGCCLASLLAFAFSALLTQNATTLLLSREA